MSASAIAGFAKSFTPIEVRPSSGAPRAPKRTSVLRRCTAAPAPGSPCPGARETCPAASAFRIRAHWRRSPDTVARISGFTAISRSTPVWRWRASANTANVFASGTQIAMISAISATPRAPASDCASAEPDIRVVAERCLHAAGEERRLRPEEPPRRKSQHHGRQECSDRSGQHAALAGERELGVDDRGEEQRRKQRVVDEPLGAVPEVSREAEAARQHRAHQDQPEIGQHQQRVVHAGTARCSKLLAACRAPYNPRFASRLL